MSSVLDNIKSEVKSFYSDYLKEDNKHQKLKKAVSLFLKTAEKSPSPDVNSEENKILLIKHYCILELLIKSIMTGNKRRINSWELNRIVRFSLSDDMWIRQVIADILDSLINFRNSVVHEYQYPPLTSDRRTSDHSIHNVLKAVKSITWLMLAQLISKDSYGLEIENIKNSWNEYIHSGIEFKLPDSKFTSEVQKYLSSQFGTQKLSRDEYFFIGLDGFGGLIISTDLRINLYYATYNHEEMKLENYQPPAPDRTIEDIKSNLSEINNTEKKKFVLFSKSPTSITFLFGYLYQAIFPETTLETLLRTKSKIEEPVIRTAIVSTDLDEIKRAPDITLCTEKDKRNPCRQKLIIVDLTTKFPLTDIPECYVVIKPKNEVIITPETLFTYTRSIIDKIDEVVGDNNFQLFMRVPTPISIILGRYYRKEGREITLWEKSYQNPNHIEKYCVLTPDGTK